jgi:formate hydrogenlyase transcriptional activator
MHHNSLSSPGHNSPRTSDQLRLLVEVSEAIATHRDLPTLFRDLAKRLPPMVPFEFISLSLHDPVKNVMRVDMLGTADADSIPPGLEIPVDESFSGQVFKTQEPVVVRSLEESARFPITLSLMQTIGAHSFCMLPLTTIVRPLGAMGFASATPRAIDEPQLEFLQLVVKQVAVAVDNALHDQSAAAAQAQLTRERDRLRLLLEVSESVASHHNLDELVHDLAHRLPRVVSFDYINLTLHDPQRNVMRLHLLVAPAASTIRPGIELAIDGSPAGLAWKTQRPVVVENIDADTRFPELATLFRDNAVKSWCAMPLTSALRPLGSMGFGSAVPAEYEDADLKFLQQVANLGGCGRRQRAAR